MNAIDKDLLLKDLSARLPYGVICRYKNENRPLFCVRPTQYYKIALDNAINVKHNGVENCVIEEVKPYLFPLSSMTEKQKEELKDEISKQTEILIERMKNDDCGIDCGKYHFHSTLELECYLKIISIIEDLSKKDLQLTRQD